MNDKMQRRDFIKQGVAAGAMLAGANANILGANDRIRVGVIGPGRQGHRAERSDRQSHLRAHVEFRKPDARWDRQLMKSSPSGSVIRLPGVRTDA